MTIARTAPDKSPAKQSNISRLRRNTTLSKSRSEKVGVATVLPLPLPLPLCFPDFTSSMFNLLGQFRVRGYKPGLKYVPRVATGIKRFTFEYVFLGTYNMSPGRR